MQRKEGNLEHFQYLTFSVEWSQGCWPRTLSQITSLQLLLNLIVDFLPKFKHKFVKFANNNHILDHLKEYLGEFSKVFNDISVIKNADQVIRCGQALEILNLLQILNT